MKKISQYWTSPEPPQCDSAAAYHLVKKKCPMWCECPLLVFPLAQILWHWFSIAISQVSPMRRGSLLQDVPPQPPRELRASLEPSPASTGGLRAWCLLRAGPQRWGVPSSGQLAKFREEGSRARLCLWRHSSAFTSVFSHFFFLAFCSLKYLNFKNSSCWRQFLEGRESSILTWCCGFT